MNVGLIVNIDFDAESCHKMADYFSENQVKSMTKEIGEEFIDCVADNRIKVHFVAWYSDEGMATFEVTRLEKVDDLKYDMTLRFLSTAS